MNVSIVIISKDEVALAETLQTVGAHCREPEVLAHYNTEIIVVDASAGRLDAISDAHPEVQWIPFVAPDGVRVSIPHQRNRGMEAASGDIIVFTDAGCIPQPGWLPALLGPIQSGEETVTAGPSWIGDNVYSREKGEAAPDYLDEAATINLAFTRAVYELVGEFDEQFEYGSDVDYTRRMVSAGHRIRYLEEAIVDHDWGGFRRQLKRSVKYGSARIRLHRKHRGSVVSALRWEPVPAGYGLFLLGLPIALRYRSYLLLLLIPLWRARKRPLPFQVVIFHLAEGYGGLKEMVSGSR